MEDNIVSVFKLAIFYMQHMLETNMLNLSAIREVCIFASRINDGRKSLTSITVSFCPEQTLTADLFSLALTLSCSLLPPHVF